MKKVLTFSLFSLLVLTLFSVKARAVFAPVDARGESLATLDLIGCQTASIDASTGTAYIMLNSTGNGGVSNTATGLIVYGVITSSISQNDFLVLKDTTGVGTNGTHLGSQNTLQSNSSTVCVIGNWYQVSGTTASTITNYPNLNLIRFPVPIQFRNGILANVSAAPVASGGAARWTILYRKLNSSER